MPDQLPGQLDLEEEIQRVERSAEKSELFVLRYGGPPAVSTQYELYLASGSHVSYPEWAVSRPQDPEVPPSPSDSEVPPAPVPGQWVRWWSSDHDGPFEGFVVSLHGPFAKVRSGVVMYMVPLDRLTIIPRPGGS